MNKSKLIKLSAGLAAAFFFFSPWVQAQWFYLQEDFESYFDTDSLQWNWPRTVTARISELSELDPDGVTVNKSLRSGGGARTTTPEGSGLYFGDVTPTNENPLVFSFRFYDPMTTVDDDEGQPVLQSGNEFATIRPSAAANFVAFGLLTWADVGTWDVTRYQARVMGPGGNWIQLATPRSQGWRDITIVIHHNTVDFYIDGQIDANGTAVPRNPGAIVDRVTLGSGLVTNTVVHYDDVVVKTDPAFARTFQIDVHPVSQDIAYGSDIVLSVEASGTGPFTYQWEVDGEDLVDGDGVSGAATPNLTVSSAVFEDTGIYRARVSDPATTQSSQGAQITVYPFLFEQHPPTLTIIEGSDAVFPVVVSGIEPFTYQWLKDGEEMEDEGAVSGTETDTLTISGASQADSAGYSVVVTNEHGTRTSNIGRLSVGPAPTGVRWGDFENVPSVPTGNGAWLFRWPGFSGTTSGNVDTTAGVLNDSIVVGTFPEGMWGARSLRLRWSFRPDLPHPWLRQTAFGAANLAYPSIGFDRYLRFDVHSNQDLTIMVGVREANTTLDYGVTVPGAGTFEWVGAADPDLNGTTAGLPPAGKFVPAGQWTTLYFDMPNENVVGWDLGSETLNGNGVLDGERGLLEALIIQPVRDSEGNYSTEPIVLYVDNFEVTEVGPPPPPVEVDLPATAIMRGEGEAIVIEVTGEPNASFKVYASDDLVDWVEVGTVDLDGDGNGVFTDPAALANDRRFYRVGP